MTQSPFRHLLQSNRVLLAALLLGFFCSVLNFLFNQHMGNDTAAYYTRMAQQFSTGNYDRAFFHSIPPLVPLLAGIVGKLGFSGWSSMKIVSSLFFLGAVFWSYKLGTLRLSDRQAQWCAFLYLICSRLLRYGMAGQLTSARIFFFLFTSERLIRFAREQRTSLLVQSAVGAALLSLSRNEGIGYMPGWLILLFLAAWLYPKWQTDVFWRRAGISVARCAIFCGIALVIWIPWMVYQHNITGWPLLSSKQIPVVGKVFPFLPTEDSDYVKSYTAWLQQRRQQNIRAELSETKGIKGIVERFSSPVIGSFPYKLTETCKGIYFRFFWLAAVGIFFLFRQHKWSRIDSILAGLIFYHLAMLWILLPNIQKRLVVSAIPLYLPWLIVGAQGIFQLVKSRWPQKTARFGSKWGYALLSLLTFAMFWNGLSSMRSTLRGRHDGIIKAGKWIAANRERLDHHDGPPLENGLLPWQYYTGDSLVIATDKQQIATIGQTDLVRLPPLVSFESIDAYLRQHETDVVVVTPSLLELQPRLLHSSSLSLLAEIDECSIYTVEH